MMRYLHRTLFGDALLELFKTTFNDGKYRRIDDLEMWSSKEDLKRLKTEEAEIAHDDFGKLWPALFPFFPDLQRSLEIPEHEFQNGIYIFKISLEKDIWRCIAIPAKMTLDRLNDKILDAYDFDSEHLHRFTYCDHGHRRNQKYTGQLSSLQ
ncbi:MAG: plasmid pRiA4b ORF-3 family protein [Desulfobacteraceae bacterium]|nr:plasmid pRiA4b ORF-3 family protein [Desulfobacteraceae bacterium]